MAHYTLVIIHGYEGDFIPCEFPTVIKTQEPLAILQERHVPYANSSMNFETGEVEEEYDPSRDTSHRGSSFDRYEKENIVRELTPNEVAELFRRIRHQNEQRTAATKNFLEI